MTDAARRADCDVHASGDYRGAYYCETHRVRYHDTIHACLCPAGKSAALADENSRLAARVAVLTEALERIARGDMECGGCTRGDPTPEDVARAALASEAKPQEKGKR